MSFILLGNRIVVEPLLKEHVGILKEAPSVKKDELDRAIVVYVGGAVKDIGVGDVVYKSKFTGIDVEIDGKKYKVVNYPDVLGVDRDLTPVGNG